MCAGVNGGFKKRLDPQLLRYKYVLSVDLDKRRGAIEEKAGNAEV